MVHTGRLGAATHTTRGSGLWSSCCSHDWLDALATPLATSEQVVYEVYVPNFCSNCSSSQNGFFTSHRGVDGKPLHNLGPYRPICNTFGVTVQARLSRKVRKPITFAETFTAMSFYFAIDDEYVIDVKRALALGDAKVKVNTSVIHHVAGFNSDEYSFRSAAMIRFLPHILNSLSCVLTRDYPPPFFSAVVRNFFGLLCPISCFFEVPVTSQGRQYKFVKPVARIVVREYNPDLDDTSLCVLGGSLSDFINDGVIVPVMVQDDVVVIAEDEEPDDADESESEDDSSSDENETGESDETSGEEDDDEDEGSSAAAASDKSDESEDLIDESVNYISSSDSDSERNAVVECNEPLRADPVSGIPASVCASDRVRKEHKRLCRAAEEQISIIESCDNKLPGRVICGPPQTNVYHKLNRTLPERAYAGLLPEGLIKMSYQPQIGGQEVRGNPSVGAYVIGPTWGLGSLFDTKSVFNMMHATEKRCANKFQFNPSPEMRLRLQKCTSIICGQWFSVKNIEMARKSFLDLFELCPTKLNYERFEETINDLCFQYGFDKPEAFLKTEVTNKSDKAPRIIINEGLHRCICNLFVMYVIEFVVFKVTGKSNIKHIAKRQFCDNVTLKNSEVVTVKGRDGYCRPIETSFVEIDQSSFDMSETYKDGEGLLTIELAIIEKVVSFIGDGKSQQDDRFSEKFRVLWDERKVDSKFCFRNRAHNIKVSVDVRRRVRHSGDRGTTVLNYVVECVSTLCSIFQEPEKILDVNNLFEMHGSTRVIDREGKYTFPYKNHVEHPTQFTVGRAMLYSWLRFWFEGDDGLLRVDRRLERFKEEIIANYNSLGLDCKLFFWDGVREPHRAEFCGVHFLVRNGCTVKYGYCPDIARAFVKHSFSTSEQCSTEKGKAAIAYASYMSRAVDFAGRVPFVAKIFYDIASSWKIRNADEVIEDEGVVKELILRHSLDLTKETRNDFREISTKLEANYLEYKKYNDGTGRKKQPKKETEVIDAYLDHTLALCDASIGKVTDAEIASVLGHEFSHDETRDSFQFLPQSLVRVITAAFGNGK